MQSLNFDFVCLLVIDLQAIVLLENLLEKLATATDRGSSMLQVESLIKTHNDFTADSQVSWPAL